MIIRGNCFRITVPHVFFDEKLQNLKFLIYLTDLKDFCEQLAAYNETERQKLGTQLKDVPDHAKDDYSYSSSDKFLCQPAHRSR